MSSLPGIVLRNGNGSKQYDVYVLTEDDAFVLEDVFICTCAHVYEAVTASTTRYLQDIVRSQASAIQPQDCAQQLEKYPAITTTAACRNVQARGHV